jgi:hypothetical protein
MAAAAGFAAEAVFWIGLNCTGVPAAIDESLQKLEEQSPEAVARVDVLHLVDLARDQEIGNWSWAAGKLECTGPGNGANIVALPAELHGGYELLIRYVKDGTGGDPLILLPVARDRTLIQLASDPRPTRVKTSGANTGSSPASRIVKLESGKEHVARIEVTTEGDDARIQLDVDGSNAIDWAGPQSSLATDKNGPMLKPLAIGLCIFDSHVSFSEVTLRMLSGELKLLSQPIKRRQAATVDVFNQGFRVEEN